MGVYDRDYVRGREGGFSLGGDRTMVTNLILANVGIWLLDLFLHGRLTEMFALRFDMLQRPWQFYTLLTYGFLHDPANLQHIAFNMFGLWMFGREMEEIRGRREFLAFYLAVVVVGGIAWLAAQQLFLLLDLPIAGEVVGASGAVVGVMVLYASYFPRRMFLLFFVLPVQAWMFCGGVVALDLYGLQQSLAGNPGGIAYEVHLAGAAFAFVYHRLNWSFGGLSAGKGLRLPRFGRPKLRVHEPQSEPPPNLSQRVDEILAKISEQGEASLSREERRILEDASRRYQRRRQ